MPELDWRITLIAARMAGMMAIAPGWSFAGVPLRMRLMLGAVLTLVVGTGVPVETDATASLACLLGEVLVGAGLGIAPAALIWGLQYAAQALKGMTGLGMEVDVEPSPLGGVLTRLFTITALSVFFLAGGHRQMLQALFDSFTALPLGTAASEEVWEIVGVTLAQGFRVGVRSALPIGLALLVSLLTLMLVQRLVPQFGYFAVGMSVQTLVLLGALSLGAGSLGWLWEAEFLESPAAVLSELTAESSDE